MMKKELKNDLEAYCYDLKNTAKSGGSIQLKVQEKLVIISLDEQVNFKMLLEEANDLYDFVGKSTKEFKSKD